MRLPPALAAPVSALTPWQRQVFSRVTTAVLLLILLWSGWERLQWPPWPVAVTDTWGYLHPALSKLRGGAFEHTYGRNFVYPGWLYLLLRATGDFRAITLAQRLLGLATGALLWTIWRQWRGWFACARLPASLDAALGLGLVAFYERSASVIQYETLLRPEAVFPFFAAGQLCLLLAFLRAWHGDARRPDRSAALAGASLFAAALVYQIKPSFGFAVGVAALPILWAAVFPWRQSARSRLRLAGAAGVAGLAALALLVLPERELAEPDPMATLFLPETLLCVHATVIRDQLFADARASAQTPYPTDWLAAAAARLDQEIHRAGEPGQKPYATLGLNPDHLMYRDDSFCRWLNDTHTPTQTAAFCLYYFRRAWTHHPGAMLANVGRQLGVFYRWICPAFWPAQKLKFARYYDHTFETLSGPKDGEPLLAYPPARPYLDAARRLSASEVVFRPGPFLVGMVSLAGRAFLPLLILFLAGMAAAWFLPAQTRRALWPPGAVGLLVNALLFGNCLTVALVHSFDVERYSANLLLYAASSEAMAAAWLCELAWACLDGKSAPAATAPAAVIPFAGLPSPAADPTVSEP